jgi:hypothetical protein
VRQKPVGASKITNSAPAMYWTTIAVAMLHAPHPSSAVAHTHTK